MANWIESTTLLAWEGEASGEGGGEGNADTNQGPPGGILPLMLMLGFFFYFIVLRPGMKDRKKHELMMNELKQNDRIVTVGGILGSVASISNDGKEVTIKVDDKTRLRVLKTHISTVVTDNENTDKNAVEKKS